MQWRWDKVMCMNSGMSLGSLITATNSKHTLLCFTQIWRLQVHLFHIGRENPTVYTSESAVPTWSMWSTLLPRPILRWTAMWAFPSNIDQRLASGHPLTGNYFFSSLMLDDNLYLCVAVCLAHWCCGGGHHGILAKKAWRRGVWLWIPDRSGTSRFFDWRLTKSLTNFEVGFRLVFRLRVDFHPPESPKKNFNLLTKVGGPPRKNRLGSISRTNMPVSLFRSTGKSTKQ